MIQDVAEGLWVWRLPHPDWREGLEWEQAVASTCVESGGEVVLLDPLAPPRRRDGRLGAARRPAAHGRRRAQAGSRP